MSDVLALALAAKEAIPALLLERTRLEFAVARHDKEGMREINKSFKHLYLDLREMYIQVALLLAAPTDEPKFEYEDWFFPHQKTIDNPEINARLIEYHRKLRDFIRAMDTLLLAAREIGMKLYFMEHLLGHIALTTLLLRIDLEDITGEFIQP